ncbi:hypothetical protein [Corallibacter sp.]|uniref:hypothetical protein n=1 Tax=Corallibacter sp. TaxID=2038084 RepID=UPI003AB80F3D
MKSTVINARISQTLKDDLEILAILKNLSFSQMTRIALEEFYNNTPIDDIPINKDSQIKPVLLEDNLLQSFEFTELIFWIYDKRIDSSINEIYEFYEQHLNLINEMHKHPRFNKKILTEFYKIRDELKFRLEGKWHGDEFHFSDAYNMDGFDYEVLRNFMYAIRYDENNNKNLFIK